jgi:Spy/CpxP family protein refolding chaperone
MAAAGLRRHEPGPSLEPQLMTQLALDPDQRARVERLRSTLVASRQEHVGAMGDLRRQLTAAMARRGEDPAAVPRVLRDLADAQAKYQGFVVDHVLSVREVLRPDQRPMFEQMVSRQMGAGGAAGCECLPAPRESAGP